MGYKTPQPNLGAFNDANQQHVLRRIYERLNNLEAATNTQSFDDGNKAPVPPKSKLTVTTHPDVPGTFFVHIDEPQFLPNGGNKLGSPLKHWLQASPDPGFKRNVTNFPISPQTHFTVSELGSGTFNFRLRSSYDGKTFNNPVTTDPYSPAKHLTIKDVVSIVAATAKQLSLGDLSIGVDGGGA